LMGGLTPRTTKGDARNLKIVMRIPLRYCFKGESN
jgi:hypothetical protein